MHVIFFIFIFLSQCLTYSQEENRKEYTLFHTSQTVKIDGILNEWKNVTPVEITVDPDEDLFHAKAYAMWDKKYLYVAFDVKDDTPMQNTGDDPFFAFKSGDTLEVFICTDPKADPERQEPIASDYRILMTYLKNIKPIIYAYHPVGNETPRYISHPSGAWKTRMDESGEIKGAYFSVKRREDNSGYSAEASIPWRYFVGFRPKPGLKLPFNFAINFSDASGQTNMAKIWWSGGGTMVTDISIELKLNTDTWGVCHFKIMRRKEAEDE